MEKFARVLVGASFGLFALVSTVCAQTRGTAVEINFDAVFEWKKPCTLNSELLEARLDKLDPVPGKKWYSLDNSSQFSQPSQLFNSTSSRANNLKYLVFGNKEFEPEGVRVMWADGQIAYIAVRYTAQAGESEAAPALLASIGDALGAPPFSCSGTSYTWTGEHYTANALFTKSRDDTIFFVTVRPRKTGGPSVVNTPGGTPAEKPVPVTPAPVPVSAPATPMLAAGAEITINLDDFIDWKIPVNLSVETFDAKLRTLETEAGGSLCRIETRPGEELRFFDRSRDVRSARVRYPILGGQYFLSYAFMHWKEGKLITIELAGMKTAASQEIEPLQTMYRLDKMFGVSHVVEADYAYSWNVPAFRAILIKSPNVGYILRLEQPRSQPVAATTTPPASGTSAVPGKQVLPASDGTVKYTMDLDPLLNWSGPLDIEPVQIDTLFAHVIKETGYRLWTESESSTMMGWGQSNVKMTLMQGRLKISQAYVSWGDRKQILFRMNETEMVPGDDEWLYNKLDEILKVRRVDRKPPNNTFVSFEWTAKNFVVRTSKKKGETLSLTISRLENFDPKGPSKEVAANLDFLLTFQSLWSTSADALEKVFTVKTESMQNMKVAPQFEWVSSAKDRARFSHHMFSNVETKLTMFGGSIKLEEAILEFVNGKVARATISFYNLGDSGDITVKEFDCIFKLIGQNLSQVMKVAPKRQIMSSNAALPVTGWMWSTPQGIALLEYNEYNTPGKVTKPEFLRLKLAAPNQADWSMGKMATGVQRMELLQRVKKTPEGDVYISGVPMVDQGQKGYCVAASCQRLFEYMRIPCDQHEMAKLVSIDAEGGADISAMQKSLAKIDGAFKVTFKPLINPELYYAANRKRRVSEKEFISIIKEYTDKGVPLLWGLMLGEKPENPPLPGGGQVSGGHMRMIIGYNQAKNQVLFTDSWGAGHELKRMQLLDAYDVTMGLYSMAPRGL